MRFINSIIEFISVDLSEYKNIGLDLDIGFITLIIFAALTAVTAVMSYRRHVLITLASRLLRREALDEESAKSCSALGINSKYASLVMKWGGPYARAIKIKGVREYTYEEYSELIKSKGYKEEKTDFSKAELYVNPESKDLIKRLSDSTPPTLISSALICLGIVAVYLLLAYFLPDIVSTVNNMLESK